MDPTLDPAIDELDGVAAGMADADLARLIDEELEDSLGYDDQTAEDRQKALEFYRGDATGELAPPDIDNRSKVVSKDLLDAVEWTMPSMMRLFAGSDEIARFEPDAPGEEQACKDASAAVAHVIWEQNPGFTTIHDAIKTCLIQRVGIVKVWCEEAFDERQESYSGLDQLQVEAMGADPSIELGEVIPSYQQATDPQTGEPAVLFDVKVKRKEPRKSYRIEGVPPEEFRIARDARTIDRPRFIAHQPTGITASDLISRGIDPELVDTLPTAEMDATGERSERYTQEGWEPGAMDVGDRSQRKIDVVEAWVLCDFDGDGVAEYRRVLKSGEIILENEVTDEHPFAVFSPILMPYRVIGLGLYDLLEDIVRIKTALTRQVLDNAYLVNNPIRMVARGAGVDLDALLNPVPGSHVDANDINGVRDLTVPNIGQDGLGLIDYINKVRDARTGVGEFNQGLGAGSLRDTKVGSEGAQDMMASAMQRVELMARVLAETGIKRMYRLVLKSLCQYQDRDMQFRVNGRWMAVNPREWHTRYRLTVSVGMGSMSRSVQLTGLNAIMALQEKAAGLVPGLVSPANAYNALSRFVEANGFRDADQFFSPPQEEQPEEEAPPPEPSPDAVVQSQALVQAEQIKAEAANQRGEQDNVVKLQIEREKIASDKAIKLAEIESRERVALFEVQARAAAAQPVMPDLSPLQTLLSEIGQRIERLERSRKINVTRGEDGGISQLSEDFS